MQFDASTPRRDRVISDILVTIPQPYIAGHTITAGEAAALNQLIAENVSNNKRQQLKDGFVPEGSPEGTVPTTYTAETAQKVIDEYVVQYEMGVRSTGSGVSRVVDPIEREARKLAKAKAKELVVNAGKKPKDVNMDEIANAIYDANVDALHTAAKKVLAAASKAGDGLNIEGLTV